MGLQAKTARDSQWREMDVAIAEVVLRYRPVVLKKSSGWRN